MSRAAPLGIKTSSGASYTTSFVGRGSHSLLRTACGVTSYRAAVMDDVNFRHRFVGDREDG